MGFASFSEIAAVVPAPSVSEVLDDAAVDAFAAAMKKKSLQRLGPRGVEAGTIRPYAPMSTCPSF